MRLLAVWLVASSVSLALLALLLLLMPTCHHKAVATVQDISMTGSYGECLVKVEYLAFGRERTGELRDECYRFRERPTQDEPQQTHVSGCYRHWSPERFETTRQGVVYVPWQAIHAMRTVATVLLCVGCMIAYVTRNVV